MNPLHRPANLLAPAIGCGAMTAIALAGGTSLAVFFAGIVAIALCVPIGASAIDRPVEQLWMTVIALASVAIVWLVPVFGERISAGQWLSCVSIALAWAMCAAGLTALLRSFRLPDTFASTIVFILAFAWLSWPIWLSPVLSDRQTLVNNLVVVHPLLTLNGQLPQLGIWTERPMMYRWTVLNQDVSYEMPTDPRWCIGWHGIVGGVTFMIYRFRKNPRRARG